MKDFAKSRRKPSPLDRSLQQRLSAYASAAGTAGVGLLALSGTSEAEVVYTPAHETINLTVGSYGLDLNHDGIVDFIIADHRTNGSPRAESRQSLFVKPDASQNRIKCVYSFCLSTFIYAAALQQGSEISATQRHGWLPGHAQMALEERLGGKPYYFGSWNRVQNKYLGFQFQINGETHYGWARLTVKFHGGSPAERSWEAELTGYAYETTAGKSIKAGQTSENSNDESEVDSLTLPTEKLTRSSALGLLALGANGIEVWRGE